MKNNMITKSQQLFQPKREKITLLGTQKMAKLQIKANNKGSSFYGFIWIDFFISVLQFNLQKKQSPSITSNTILKCQYFSA